MLYEVITYAMQGYQMLHVKMNISEQWPLLKKEGKMHLTESVLNYRRYLKRKNYSPHTVKNYLHRLQRFFAWLPVPLEAAKRENVKWYIDFLLQHQLSAQTINGHLVVIRMFYEFLKDEGEIKVDNPVGKGLLLRVAKPLPRHLRA